MTHNRFDEEHRKICTDCFSEYFNFLDEQEDEARLDAAIETEDQLMEQNDERTN